MRVALLALVGCLATANSFAQPVRAVTEAGGPVVLFADGVWASDNGTVLLPAVREGQRHASEWFRYAIWAPEGWATMAAVEANYDGEVAFVPGGDQDSVVVTIEYLPMESSAMEEGDARQRVVERYSELFGMRFPVEERSVAGHRVTTIRITELGSRQPALLSAVTAPGGAVLLNVYGETTGLLLDAIASRFLQGIEIEFEENPGAFFRNPCGVYTPLQLGFALDVPEGWSIKSVQPNGSMGVFDIELVEQNPSPGLEAAVAFVITANVESDESRSLGELGDAFATELLDVHQAAAEWDEYVTGPWPPGSPSHRADRTYLLPDAQGILDVAIVRGSGHVALVAVAAANTSARRRGLDALVEGVRVCR